MAYSRWQQAGINFANAVTLSYGWRRRAISFGSGLFGAAALAPIGFFPAMAVMLVASVWMLDGIAPLKSSRQRGFLFAQLREAWEIGWFTGFGYFVASLWWLGAAFLVEADEFAWALPLGVFGLPAVLAIFNGLGLVVARLLWCEGPSRILAFALGLGLAEWARSLLFTGFPWNSIGMSLGTNLVLAQAASLVGLHGLTLLALVIFASPALVFDHRKGRPSRFLPAWLSGLALLVLIAGFGALRLWHAQGGTVADVSLRIVQPNIAQDAKFRPENGDDILGRYLDLSDMKTERHPDGLQSVTHVFWPESAFPFIVSKSPKALAQISLRLGAAHLVTGAARAEAAGTLPGEAASVSYFNSIQVIGAGGSILDTYDKVHLVPFGEYLPLSGLLERLGLRQFVHVPGGFEPGLMQKLLRSPGLPAMFPMVCYEAIFPGILSGALREGAGLIVNVTNDGWFGQTPGPYQHLAQARLRSIESGLPLIRVANTGISTVTDPYGKIIGSLPLGAAGVIDTALPAAIPPTLFSNWPLASVLCLYFMFFVLLMVSRRNR